MQMGQFQILITKARHPPINPNPSYSQMRKNSDSSSSEQNPDSDSSQGPQLNHLAPIDLTQQGHTERIHGPARIMQNSIGPGPGTNNNSNSNPNTYTNTNTVTNTNNTGNTEENIMIEVPNPIISRLLVQHEERPRLIIDRIVLQNFKSYADTQTIGPFHENFTSVVGPNGSGKSNLIESMLFIFGYKANWMRLNRLNQLIHNSSTMGNVERASVQVHFKKILQDGEGKVTVLQGSEFSIRRTVKNSGSSKYHINEQESTQGEVKQLLQKQGIDLNNNRFLILQGQVQQISQMRQKSGDRQKPGLLEYLEDIIGSNIYIEQIETSVTEYNTIEETKHQKGELMKLAQIELKGLNKGKEEAIRYVRKERLIYQVHNILQQVIISNSRYQHAELGAKLAKAQAQKQRIISQQKQKLKKQADRIRQIKKHKLQIQAIQRDLARQNELMVKMSTADKNINQQISFKSQDLVKYQRKVNDYDQELSKIISESNEVKEALPAGREKLEKLKVQLEEMEEELVKYDKPELKAKMKNYQNQLKRIQHEIKTFSDKEKNTRKTFEVKYKSSQKSQIQIVQLQHKLQQNTQTLQKITHAETQATKIKQSLSKQLETLTSTRKECITQLQKLTLSLRQRQHQFKQLGNFNDMFQKIMQQNISGVIGRLGDLGTVPKQYEEIITSCCGRLDNIVVRDMDAAGAVLSFLKATKLGRVTCIILDKIQEQRKFMERHFEPLPQAVRLFDMITPQSQQIRIAFYFAINDTIYCQNSQLGMQYSMKDDRNRRRVISRKPGGYIIYELNGLINGTLPKSGGFTVRAKSKMRKQGVDGDREVKEMERGKVELGEKIGALEEKFRRVKGEYEGVMRDIEEFKREKRTITQQLNQTRQELEQIQKSSATNAKSFKQNRQKFQKQLQALTTQISTLQKQKKQLLSSISKIQSQQRSTETQKISRLRDSHKITKQQYHLLDKDLQKKVAILETTIKRVDENKRNKMEIGRKIEMLEKEVKKLEKEREDIQIKAAETFGKIKSGQERIQKCRKNQEQLKVLFQQEQKQVRQSKIKIEKAKQQVEQCRQKMQVHGRTIHQAQQQLKKQRQTYRQLSATYDFLEQLDTISGMQIQEIHSNSQPHAPHAHNKSDTSVLMNQSIDSLNSSMTKVFPLEKLLEVSPFEDLSEERLDQFLLFTEKLRTMLVMESENLKKMSGNNLAIISEFRAKFRDFKKKHQEFQAVKNSQMQLKKKIEQLKKNRLECFIKGFSIINSKLKQVYQLLTRGGDAELELTDSLDPFSDGITFSVRPPKKAWKQINKLSGGQKTLSSLSLIFALHYFKPTPLYFMDEIDAALDFKNVSIVAQYIKKRTKDAQFIIISLRNNMFELADKLVGVYKTYDKTKIIHFVPVKMRRLGGTVQKENFDSNKN